MQTTYRKPRFCMQIGPSIFSTQIDPSELIRALNEIPSTLNRIDILMDVINNEVLIDSGRLPIDTFATDMIFCNVKVIDIPSVNHFMNVLRRYDSDKVSAPNAWERWGVSTKEKMGIINVNQRYFEEISNITALADNPILSDIVEIVNLETGKCYLTDNEVYNANPRFPSSLCMDLYIYGSNINARCSGRGPIDIISRWVRA